MDTLRLVLILGDMQQASDQIDAAAERDARTIAAYGWAVTTFLREVDQEVDRLKGRAA